MIRLTLGPTNCLPSASCRVRVWAGGILMLILILGLTELLGQRVVSSAQTAIAEGLELLRRGQPTDAKVRFDAAIKIAPQSADARTWRGICENQMQQYAAAAADFRAALQMDPATLPAHYNLALSLIRLHQIDAAVEQLRIVIAAQPKAVQPQYNLAILLEGKGALAEAKEHFAIAHALDPADETTTVHLARMLLATDQAEEAKVLLSHMPIASNNAAQIKLAAPIHMMDGVALAATHEIEKAQEQLRKAIEEDPALALAHNVLGFCLFQQGRYVQAAETYGKASELEPNRLLYARDAALAYERANQNDQALTFAERANALRDADAGDRVLLGKLYAAGGRRQDAVRELRRAAELNPELDAAYYLLARTYLQMGDRQQATVWSDKLRSLKQRHEAAFALQKKAQPATIRSSTLLEGGSMSTVEASAP